MIVKKVPNPKKSASKSQRIGQLTRYVRSPESESSKEKCLYAGARGFIMDSPESQTAEMIALSQEAVRSKDTCNHYVLSWQEGEQPSPDQVEEAVNIFMEELGWKDHQAIYGLHTDTDNVHLHIVINRVHPETLKIVEKNRGFDIELAHRAVSRIEHAQGWQSEQNGRYQILENGELGRRATYDPDKPRQPDQKKRDMENRTGEKSALRIAIEDGAPIIKEAQSWEQLHRELAAKGMRYEKTGSGATVFVGDVGVKASDVDRNASLAKLQKRFGPYQPAPPQQVAQREPEPIKPVLPGWKDYITGRKAHYAEKRAAKLAMDKQHEQERNALQAQQKASRDELMRGNWRGKGELLNALRSVIAAEQAAEKAALKEQHQRQRAQWRQQFRPYPDLEQWLRLQRRPDLAQQWRYRASEDGPQCTWGDRSEPPTPRDIRNYTPVIVGAHVHYIRQGESEASFVDKGKQIDIHDWRNPDRTLAALQLSAQKWGSFTVTGNDEYQAMCARLAAEHGFKITNPELQESIQQERQRIQQERSAAPRPTHYLRPGGQGMGY